MAKYFGSLAALAFFLIFIQANAPSLDSDGIHYAAVAEEVARTNRWIYMFDPILGHIYYWHFPMSIWPTALCFQWFGVSPLTAKLYSMVMTWFAVAGLYVLGRILISPWGGWCAGMAFLLTDHVLRIGRQCRPDLPLIAFLVWAFVGLMLAQGRPPRRRWYWLAGAACLGAIMTKEMVGLVPLAVAAATLLLRRQWRELFHPAFLGCWVLAIAPVAAWAWTEQVRFGETLWAVYRRQSVDFFTWQAQHLAKPWYYYGWAILDKYWYLLPLAIAGAWLAWGRIRQGKEPRWVMVFLWAAALPLGFSIALHKVHYYILPTYAATALLVALAAEQWIRPAWRPRIVAGVSGLGVAAAVALACFPVSVHKTRYRENIQLAPLIDPILAQAPGEVISVRQDVASLLLYSKTVARVTSAHAWPAFRDLLSQPTTGRRYCLITEEDWEGVGPEARKGWQVLLHDGSGRVFVKQEAGL